MHRYGVALGSNLGPSAALLREALLRLERDLEVTACSRLYLNPAWGVTDQPDFVNGVALVDFDGPPQLLLAFLLEVEQEFGRVRLRRWGPRLLDLDVLTFRNGDTGAEERYTGHGLTIPHPGLMIRPFVLAPLREVLPGWRHPETGQDLDAAWSALPEEERRAVQPLARPAR